MCSRAFFENTGFCDVLAWAAHCARLFVLGLFSRKGRAAHALHLRTGR